MRRGNLFDNHRLTRLLRRSLPPRNDKTGCCAKPSWGDGSWEDISDPQALHEANLLKLNCDKAHAELHWYSKLTIEECLQMTAQWYKIFYAAPTRDSMYEICTQQIAELVERTK